MLARGAGCEPAEDAARVAVPVGSAEAGEGRDEVRTVALVDVARERLERRAAVDAERPRHPVQRGAAGEDVALDARTWAVGEPGERLATPPGLGQSSAIGVITDEPVPYVALPVPRQRSRRGRRARRGSRPAPRRPAARRAARRARSVAPKPAVGAADLRQRLSRHAEQVEQLGVPVERVQVHQQRARGVARLAGEHRAAGEPADQPGVDRAGADVASSRRQPPGVEQPAQLGGGEHRVEREARARATSGSAPVGAQRSHAGAVRASCQPISGPAGAPSSRRQTTADSRWLDSASASGCASGACARHCAHGGHHAGPDLLGVLLDPARPRVRAADRRSPAGDDRAVVADEHGLGARGALVDRRGQRGHVVGPAPSELVAASAMPSAVSPKRSKQRLGRAGRREHARARRAGASAPGAQSPRPRRRRRPGRRAPCAPRP